MDDNTIRANFQAMSSAADLYKAKDYVKAYEAAKAIIANGEVPEPFILSCAWIIYRYFKQMAGNISNENIEICSNSYGYSSNKACRRREVWSSSLTRFILAPIGHYGLPVFGGYLAVLSVIYNLDDTALIRKSKFCWTISLPRFKP